MELFFGVLLAFALLYFGTGKSSVVGKITNAVNFVRNIYPDVKALQAERGINPAIALVQAAHESGFGLSSLSLTYKNLFGIKKSKDWKGGTVNLPTKEVDPKTGKLYPVNQYFKTYPSYRDSLEDWAELLQTGYPLAYAAAQQGDFELFFEGLATGKWGAYAGPADGSFVRSTYSKNALALLPSIVSALSAVA